MDESNPRRSRGRPRNNLSDVQSGTLQSLDRALLILTGLAREGRSTLTDISLRLGVPTATTHRILNTLQGRGFAEFDEASQEWMVGVEAFRIGAAFVQRSGLAEICRPRMRELMLATGETANLAVIHDGDVVFIEQVETHHPIRAFFQPGARARMHASGTGKALLAEMGRSQVEALIRRNGLEQYTPQTLTQPDRLFTDLEETRNRGWSFDNEERYAGMSCIGAAILNATGEPVAGISVSGPTTRFDARQAADIGPRVRRAARDVSAALGWDGSSAA
ncbi:MAG: HTH-type transcriptional regulator BhcR, partial [Pseudomonadota bacterium]